MGSRNHELVPTPLISQIAGLRSSTGVHKCISNLAKIGLLAKIQNAKYDGSTTSRCIHTRRAKSSIQWATRSAWERSRIS
jgi:RIO-like serine/threonine protein kinase